MSSSLSNSRPFTIGPFSSQHSPSDVQGVHILELTIVTP
jgi:hypothetical protein